MKLQLLKDEFAVCQLTELREAPDRSDFWSLTVTKDEYSLVCKVSELPVDAAAVEAGWRAMKIVGILDFSMVGVIAAIAQLLCEAEVSIFVVSTYNTDYVLVKERSLQEAIKTLRAANYEIDEG